LRRPYRASLRFINTPKEFHPAISWHPSRGEPILYGLFLGMPPHPNPLPNGERELIINMGKRFFAPTFSGFPS